MSEISSKIKELSPEAFARLRQKLRAKTQAANPGIRRLPSRERFPLSFGQRRFWFLDQYEHDSAGYNIHVALQIEGPLDAERVRRCFEGIVQRHESLRTAFVSEDGYPYQRILASRDLDFTYWVASGEPGQELARRAELACRTTFDLARDPLMKVLLFRIGEQRHVLLLVFHHIVADHWSQMTILREFALLYSADREGRQTDLPPLSIQYGDYAAWQWEQAGGPGWRAHEEFWREQLKDAPSLYEMPLDWPRGERQTHHGRTLSRTLDAARLQRLNAFSRQHGVTLFATLMTAYQVLIHRYSGSRDIVVGTPVAGRNAKETEPLVGFFVNNLAIRANIDPEAPFEDLLARQNATILQAFAHRDYPFEKLVEILKPDRSIRYPPVFQTAFALHNAPVSMPPIEGLAVTYFPMDVPTSKYDFMLEAVEVAGDLLLQLEYNTDLFSSAAMHGFLDHFAHLVDAILEQPTRPIGRLNLLGERERADLLQLSEAKASISEESRCIHEVFQACAERHAERIAVRFGAEEWSYRTLNEKARQLSNYLYENGVRAGDRVGLVFERSLDMITAILGVLMAGGAYVPLDPSYPRERVQFMADDADCVAFLASDDTDLPFDPRGRRVIGLSNHQDRIERSSEPPVPREVSADNAAYIIYTSGSTGVPKGTIVTHRNVVRLFRHTDALFGFHERDVWTCLHSYAFDFSVWEIWGALLYGGRLVVVPKRIAQSPERLVELLCSEKVTVLNQTPSAFYRLAACARARSDGLGAYLRYVVFGGEALNIQALTPWIDVYGDEHPRLVNMYGITETTVHVTYRRILRTDLASRTGSLIGAPIGDLSLHILDAHLQPCPIGVPGEICVGGGGVSRGYLNRPDLTKARFVDHPFGAGPMYRSGDIGKRTHDGDIEYCGRIDDQVKIRGFRIELGEIEAVIRRRSDVEHCVVLAKPGIRGDNELFAYVLPRSSETTAVDIRRQISAELPEYMMPKSVVLVEEFPLTENGKIDRRRLPQVARSEDTSAVQEPVESEIELLLVRIWKKCLEVPAIDVNANFFDIGGNSFLALEIVNEMNAGSSAPVDVVDFFRYPTVRAMAAYLDRDRAQPARESRRNDRAG